MPDLVPFERPNSRLLASELPRAVAEGVSFAWAAPVMSRLPKGDGHAVVMLPGFSGSDPTTAPFRLILRQLGYEAYGWEQGTNWGMDPVLRSGLRTHIETVMERAGRKVTLVGHSLGGVFAREIARARPDLVRQVITLGSPFAGDGARTSNIAAVYQAVTGTQAPELSAVVRKRLSSAPPVPTTAIYTRADGVVDWRSCVQLGAAPRAANPSENIEVRGSHTGLVVNPSVLFAVADRLAQPEYRRKPFHRRGWRALVYPKPAA